ncbi:hypothetical protein D6779_09825 [Candidatus Parcubacteria bacterium]|nr:MAG: hypothetical protein D6779_09825 [Candidatus Parcubacteria bacterium]
MKSCNSAVNNESTIAQLLYRFIKEEYGAESFEMTPDLVIGLGLTTSELLTSISSLIKSGKLSREADQDGVIRFKVIDTLIPQSNHFDVHVEALIT